jgi:protein-S-isoprenylcysteine O-methyltransferase Ste14
MAGHRGADVVYVVRHVLSIVALPGLVAIFVPRWIARSYDIRLAPVADFPGRVLQLLGVGVLLVGLTLFAASLYHFATRGRGTLAPWDPPRVLVVGGPYRFVRNPMISGVIFVLFGEALVLLSLPHAAWAATFFLINAVYIPLFEEPALAARFGGAYQEYTRHVRRFVPRLQPWRQPESAASPFQREA